MWTLFAAPALAVLPMTCPEAVPGPELAAILADRVAPPVIAATSRDAFLTYADDLCPAQDGATCTSASGATWDGTFTETWYSSDDDDCGEDSGRESEDEVTVDLACSVVAPGATVRAEGTARHLEGEYCGWYTQEQWTWSGSLSVEGSWGDLEDDEIDAFASVDDWPSTYSYCDSYVEYTWDGRSGDCIWTSHVRVEDCITMQFVTGEIELGGVVIGWHYQVDAVGDGWSVTESYTRVDGTTTGDGEWAIPASYGTTPVDADADGVAASADCDDANRGVHPGATEACGDAVDDDCDGSLDTDCDGYAGEDCDDEDGSAYPGAADVCGDGVDQDCDGYDADDCDGDGYSSDCDDADPEVHPGAADACGDHLDSDCDDSDAARGESCDRDEDGFIGEADCDDERFDVHPGVAEVCGDGIDQDCDGVDPDCDGPRQCGGSAALLVLAGLALKRRILPRPQAGQHQG